MESRVDGTKIHGFPRAFINRKGEAILVHLLDEKIQERLVQMYLAYQPRNSFQGLPPIKDEACVKWVQHMIGNGVNVVALSFENGVVGHAAVFPFDNRVCEMFVVVSPAYQNTGIGTELTRSSVQLSYEIGFEKIWLDVESTNVRARHVYKKCGFEYVAKKQSREVEMELDLKRYRDAVSVSIARIVNKGIPAVHVDDPCRAALRTLLAHGMSSLPVIDSSGQLQGILSEADLMQPSNIDKHVRDIYTQQAPTAAEDCTIAKLIRIFQAGTIGCIPVVDAEKKLVGMVSRKDILAYYAEHFPPAAAETSPG